MSFHETLHGQILSGTGGTDTRNYHRETAHAVQMSEKMGILTKEGNERVPNDESCMGLRKMMSAIIPGLRKLVSAIIRLDYLALPLARLVFFVLHAFAINGFFRAQSALIPKSDHLYEWNFIVFLVEASSFLLVLVALGVRRCVCVERAPAIKNETDIFPFLGRSIFLLLIDMYALVMFADAQKDEEQPEFVYGKLLMVVAAAVDVSFLPWMQYVFLPCVIPTSVLSMLKNE